MLAVDTNVLIRMIVRDDAKQANLADHYVSKGVWVSHIVLVETLWVLDSVYDLNAAKLIETLTYLLAHESLVIQDANTVSAALAHFQNKPALGFSDCLVLEVARKAGHVPLGTFDKALSKLPDSQKL